MTYTCREAILGMLYASGPQEVDDLKRECEEQAAPYSLYMFETELKELLHQGIVIKDPEEGFIDLPSTYYGVPV